MGIQCATDTPTARACILRTVRPEPNQARNLGLQPDWVKAGRRMELRLTSSMFGFICPSAEPVFDRLHLASLMCGVDPTPYKEFECV